MYSLYRTSPYVQQHLVHTVQPTANGKLKEDVRYAGTAKASPRCRALCRAGARDAIMIRRW